MVGDGHMSAGESTIKTLRDEIIAETKRFLAGLESGASEEMLNPVLLTIRQKESDLIQQEGSMLAPEMWRLLHNLLAHRRNTDFIDTTSSSKQ